MTEAGCTHTQCVLYISQSIDLKETHVHLMLKKKKLCSANAGMLYHIVLYCMELYCMELHGIKPSCIKWYFMALHPIAAFFGYFTQVRKSNL